MAIRTYLIDNTHRATIEGEYTPAGTFYATKRAQCETCLLSRTTADAIAFAADHCVMRMTVDGSLIEWLV